MRVALPKFADALLIFSAWFALAGTGSCYGQVVSPVSITLDQTSVTLGEPVLLTIRAKNSFSESVELDLGYDREDDVLVSMIDPQGHKTEKAEASTTAQGMQFFGWAN